MTDIPPHDIEAERAVLGAMLLDGEAASLMVETLAPEDFYRSQHRRIFGALRKLCADGQVPDELLLREILERYGVLEEVGGSDYIHELARAVPSAANVDRYAAIVRENADRRALINACTASLREAEESPSASEAIARAHSRITGLALRESKEGDSASLADIMPAVWEELVERHANPRDVWGLATGLEAFDARTGGLHPGHFYIIAARRSIGKTALALTFLDNICVVQQRPAMLFTLEMSRNDIAYRLVSMRSGISFANLQRGRISGDIQWDSVVGAQAELARGKLNINDTAAIRLDRVQAGMRRMCVQDGVELVVVDYLQIMSPPRAQTREREVAMLSAGLKALARELELPVIALSQFRKAKSGEEDRWPRLDDLRDTGALGQDADVVAILHRKRKPDGWYETDTILDIAKQRNGPTGPETIVFQPERMRFVDRSRQIDRTRQKGEVQTSLVEGAP